MGSDNGLELLSMNEVLKYLLECNEPLVKDSDLTDIPTFDKSAWNDYVDLVRGMIITKPGMVSF